MATLLWKGGGPGEMRARMEATLGTSITVQPWSAPTRTLHRSAVLDLRGVRGGQALRAVNDWVTRAATHGAGPTLVVILGRPPVPLSDEGAREVLSYLAGTRRSFEPAVPFEEAVCAALDLWRAPLLLSGGRVNFVVLPEVLEAVTFMNAESSAAAADLLTTLLSPATRALQGQLMTVDGGLTPLGLTFCTSPDQRALPPELDFAVPDALTSVH